ncbi:hypothetical protein SteCoe_19785 [Stentor coeruleus]|uniref:Uncharacterized protein n=1 Tax=Stentor coeruleus TaxID=5963 RepID=A0A1R2BTI0_9CILI|nr:hypothetical protein SteCoe_19785 [Stentor coeruleus]
MIDNINLIKDLHKALSSTLYLSVSLEKFKSQVFKKKTTPDTTENILKISKDLVAMQNTMEKYKILKKKELPLIPKIPISRSQTPNITNITASGRNLIKECVKMSNSRLCSSRAGNSDLKGRNTIVNDEKYAEYSENIEIKPSQNKSFSEFLKKFNSNKNVLIEKHIISAKMSRNNMEKGKMLQESVERLIGRFENPKSTIKQCISSFKKLQNNQNGLFMEKLRRKIKK